MKAEIVNADSIEHLKTLDDNCIDAVVTDPPYGLGNCSSRAVNEALTAWIAGQEYKPRGGGFMGKSWDAFVPGPELWREVYRVLKPGGHAVIFAGSRTVDLMGIAVRLSGFEVRDMLHWIYGSGFPKNLDVSKAILKRGGAEQADHWEGWGTALKPAHEPILLCRKPLEGTVVDNVERWGVGGLNIDGCRIETEDVLGRATGSSLNRAYVGGIATQWNSLGTTVEGGRWPANILLDDHAASLVDIQAGLEASRFFYCAKAGREERESGLDARPSSLVNDGRKKSIDNAYQRGKTERRNIHPTVKPLAVMRWLCRLITPTGGLILDPFNGSGTTGCAAVQLGFSYLGIEREPEYAAIARARVAHWGCIKLPEEQKTPKKKQPSLF